MVPILTEMEAIVAFYSCGSGVGNAAALIFVVNASFDRLLLLSQGRAIPRLEAQWAGPFMGYIHTMICYDIARTLRLRTEGVCGTL
jgi:hypothetical protein